MSAKEFPHQIIAVLIKKHSATNCGKCSASVLYKFIKWYLVIALSSVRACFVSHLSLLFFYPQIFPSKIMFNVTRHRMMLLLLSVAFDWKHKKSIEGRFILSLLQNLTKKAWNRNHSQFSSTKKMINITERIEIDKFLNTKQEKKKRYSLEIKHYYFIRIEKKSKNWKIKIKW